MLTDSDRIAWRPIPGTTQELALVAPVHHLLLAGGRGWGKTELQLMRFRARVGMGYGSYWRGMILDREYKNLDDLVTKSKRLFYGLDQGRVRWLSSNSDYKWVWDTGEELLFRVAKREDDYWSYHGHEYPFLGWNELTKFPSNKLYQKFMSVNRAGFDAQEHTPRLTGETLPKSNMTDVDEWNWSIDDDGKPINAHIEGREFKAGDYKTQDGQPLPPIPLECVSTTNPWGPGHNWVKTQFIDPVPYGRAARKEYTIFDPKTKQDLTIQRTQMALFGTFRENPYLSPEYIAGLMDQSNENIVKAWVNGSWDIVAGGAFDDIWKKGIHVLPRFKIPSTWKVDRSLDWGSAHPFSVGWFAECNGEEAILPDGRVFAPPPGTIIQIAELYGTKSIGTNDGVKWSSTKVAQEIKKREIELMAGGWITTQPSPGPADNQISNVTDAETETIEKKMAAAGIKWEKSDKAKGSRQIGLELMRDRLEAATKGEGKALYFMDNCRASIATIPILPRDDDNPEDVDTDAEDHPYDMVRYRVLKSGRTLAKVITVNFGS